MNPFGGGKVVVTGDLVTDDGNFFTQNNQPVPLRWVVIYAGGAAVFGSDPPRRLAKSEGRPANFMRRDELGALRLSFLPAGEYRIRLWGGVDSDPSWYEIGSGNSADNGQTDVRVEAVFRLGETVDPLTVLRSGVEQLERSSAYRSGYSNVVQGTKKCRKALEDLT